MSTVPTIDTDSFNVLHTYLKNKSGYVLHDDKRYLLESRLERLIKEGHVSSVQSLIDSLRQNKDGALHQRFIEAMTINETYFFRDQRVFDGLTNHLVPECVGNGVSNIRIWSAACSHGQEPYSLAMQLELHKELWAGKRYSILATDINTQVLDSAAKGSFSDYEINRGLPETLRAQFFTKTSTGWEANAALKKNITFKQFNLKSEASSLGSFEIIFLRNVLIYFDDALKEHILNQCYQVLSPGGALALGGTESISRLQHQFPRYPDSNGFYRKS